MPNPQEIQLQRVCSKPETFKRGQEIMRLALVKTRPGSGYDLATGASGLPPICAYIASQELNNGDITQKVAQSASCLNDKVFARTLNVVRKAIANDGKPPTKKRKLDSSSIKANGRSTTDEIQDFSVFEAAMSGGNAPDRALSPHAADMDLHTFPSSPGPSTPRRTPRSTPQNQTKITGRGRELAMEVDQASDRDHSPSPAPPPRRFRPIFLDRKQWSLRDPKILREWPAMMEHKRNMIDLYGHPFSTQVPGL